ncbi:MAG: RDD family protein [Thermomicrobiales bacterium]
MNENSLDRIWTQPAVVASPPLPRPQPLEDIARRYASLGVRAGAILVDGVVGLILLAVAAVMFGRAETVQMTTTNDGQVQFNSGVSFTLDPAQTQLVILAWFVYLIACEAVGGATLGKRLLGLRVVRADGSPLGVRHAIARHLTHAVVFFAGVFLIGPFWTLFGWFFIYVGGAIMTSKSLQRQRLGDRLAGTVVTHARGSRADTGYAGFWRRAGASLLDTLVLLAVFAVSYGIAYIARGGEDATAAALLLYLLAAGAYVVVGNGRGATLGKRWVGLHVVDATGGSPGLRRAAVRYVLAGVFGALNAVEGLRESSNLDGLTALVLLAIPLSFVDGLWMVWDGRKQTLHDKLAGTFVVHAGAVAPQLPPAQTGPWGTAPASAGESFLCRAPQARRLPTDRFCDGCGKPVVAAHMG